MEWLRDLLNLPPQGGEFAQQSDLLHLFVIGIAFAGSLAVGVLALVFGLRHRRGARRHHPERVTPIPVEIALVLGLLALFLLWWVLGWRVHRAAEAPVPGAFDVQVVAKQWMWKAIYPDGRETVDRLVLPADRPVRLHLTSRDVIHSFYLPAFRLKKDVLPHGTSTLRLRPKAAGSYQLLCAEYCGLQHSQMRGVVQFLDEADWAAWWDSEAGTTDLAERGRLAAIRHGCFGCHTTDGDAHIGPSFLGRYGRRVPLASGSTELVDGDYLTRSMMDPREQIAAGFRDLMPSYRDRLDPADAAAIVAYIRALNEDRVEAGETPLPIPESEAWR